MFKVFRKEIELNGKKIILETGKIARQADGAIIATCGETIVLANLLNDDSTMSDNEDILEKISLLKQESIDYAQFSLSSRPWLKY